MIDLLKPARLTVLLTNVWRAECEEKILPPRPISSDKSTVADLEDEIEWIQATR